MIMKYNCSWGLGLPGWVGWCGEWEMLEGVRESMVGCKEERGEECVCYCVQVYSLETGGE